MKYDITKALVDTKGEPFKENGEVQTIKLSMERMLLSELDEQGNRNISGAVKNQRFKLWHKIDKCDGTLELTVEEVNTLKGCANILTTFFYGQFVEFLDGG